MPLHITSDARMASALNLVGIDGEVLVWQDDLHVGPVPSGLALEELSELRARFMGSLPGAPAADGVLLGFRRRDEALRRFKRHGEVVLWTNDGLGGQLHLVQLLAWFAQRDLGTVRLSRVPWGSTTPDDHAAAAAPVTGREAIAELWESRAALSATEIELGRKIWEAFCYDDPVKLEDLGDLDLSLLPEMEAALMRLMQQYPSTEGGLSRSEEQILAALERGVTRIDGLFHTSQVESEKTPFISRALFATMLWELAAAAPALIAGNDGVPLFGPDRAGEPAEAWWQRELALTDPGREVLHGQADRVELSGIDRWLGGVHLHGSRVRWRWSPRRQSLVVRAV